MTDQLDRVLHDDAGVALEDAGFTERVLRTLPPRMTPAREWWRAALLLGSAALGSLLAALFLPAGSALVQGYIDLAQNRGFTPAAVTVIAMAAVLAISSIVLAADTE